MSARNRTLLAPILERQHDLVTPAQAVAHGVTRAALQRMTVAGELELVRPRVYGRVGASPSWERDLHAAVLSAGPPAQASHRAAARLLQVPNQLDAPLEISVGSKRKVALDGVIVHESRDLRYVPSIEIDGIPCSPPRRVAVDIGAVLGPTAYTTVIRELRRSHRVTWRQLVAILDLHSKRGRDGCGPLRRQLERYYGVDGIPESTLEQTFLDSLIDDDLPLPVCQYVVHLPEGRHFRLDFAYVDIGLAIEIDGPHHRQAEVERRDAWRDAVLRGLGWDVLHFDEHEVTYRPELVLNRVRRALRAAGALLVLR